MNEKEFLKLAKVAEAGRALAIAAKTLDMKPEDLTAIVTGYANSVLRGEFSDVVTLERAEPIHEEIEGFDFDRPKESKNITGLKPGEMRFKDVYEYVTDLVEPFSASLKDDLWQDFLDKDGMGAYSKVYSTTMIPTSRVKELFDCYDPSGMAFRKLECEVCTHQEAIYG